MTTPIEDRVTRVESALRAQAACMEEQGARIVELERKLSAPHGMSLSAALFKPTPAEADVGIGGKP